MLRWKKRKERKDKYEIARKEPGTRLCTQQSNLAGMPSLSNELAIGVCVGGECLTYVFDLVCRVKIGSREIKDAYFLPLQKWDLECGGMHANFNYSSWARIPAREAAVKYLTNGM